MRRPIIKIDETKCDGCGQCVLDCAEGALAVINGKARLVSESFCDGLGACLHCPQGALSIVTRDAPAFDEAAAFAAKHQSNGIEQKVKAGCPGSTSHGAVTIQSLSRRSPVSSWPIQLRLVPPSATFLQNAHILLAAHCSGFLSTELQEDGLLDRTLIIACPKLEPKAELLNKLIEILRVGQPVGIDIMRMSVPCCGGLERLVADAMTQCAIQIPVQVRTVAVP